MKRSITRFYTLVVVSATIATTIAVEVFLESTKETADLLNLLIAIISLLIALFAFHISLRTYLSIDSVNNISRMDGNIMENEGYRTNLVALLNQFSDTDENVAGKRLVDYISNLFSQKKEYSGIEFANNLQQIVDVLVLFPFFFKTNNREYSEVIKTDINKLMGTVKVKFHELNQISSGTLLLLEETIKMIDAVIAHQQSMSESVFSKAFTIQQVRGTMLKNNLSKTIYYNYFGLYNLHKALEHISISIAPRKIRDLTTLKYLHFNKPDKQNDDIRISIIYLQDAVAAFEKARTFISEDLMWNGFIKYNLSRALFHLELLSDGITRTWLKTMNESINDRLRLNLLIQSISNNREQSYLQRAFIAQEKMARLMKIKLLIASNSDITDENGITIATNSDYSSLLTMPLFTETDDEFRRLGIRNEIRHFISNDSDLPTILA